jgi:hypothetical protein
MKIWFSLVSLGFLVLAGCAEFQGMEVQRRGGVGNGGTSVSSTAVAAASVASPAVAAVSVASPAPAASATAPSAPAAPAAPASAPAPSM